MILRHGAETEPLLKPAALNQAQAFQLQRHAKDAALAALAPLHAPAPGRSVQMVVEGFIGPVEVVNLGTTVLFVTKAPEKDGAYRYIGIAF